MRFFFIILSTLLMFQISSQATSTSQTYALPDFNEMFLAEVKQCAIKDIIYEGDTLIRYPPNLIMDNYSIPEGILHIDVNAFVDVGTGTIQSLTLPSTLVSIGGVYGGCTDMYLGGVKNIYVHERNSLYSSLEGLLVSKNKQRLLFYPHGRTEQEFIVPDSIQIIGEYSCVSRNFHEVIFPLGLTHIEEGAFYGNFLKTISFPDTLLSIGDNAFEASQGIKEIVFPLNLETIGYCAFAESTIEKIILNDGLTHIDSCAFLGTTIKDIYLVESLEFIGEDVCVFGDENGEPAIPIYSAEEDTYAYDWIHQEELRWK